MMSGSRKAAGLRCGWAVAYCYTYVECICMHMNLVQEKYWYQRTRWLLINSGHY